MPKKLDKYGMKLFLMYDCTSGYTYNGLPYTGREGDTRRVRLVEHVVKTLCNPVHNFGISVTTDNWFTSTKLAEALLLNQITLLETLRKNKPDIPKQFATGKNREVGSSLFAFRNRQALVSYVPKKNKAMFLLSTMHSDKEVDEATEKPLMILDHNATKAAVDRVDQLCHN